MSALLPADFADLEAEFALLREMVEVSGRPMSISTLQDDARPEQWRRLLALLEAAARAGLPMRGQVAARPVGVCLGLQATLHPFCTHPSFQALASLPLAEQVKRLREPELRRRLLAEECAPAFAMLGRNFERLFELGDPPDYEPPPSASSSTPCAQPTESARKRRYGLITTPPPAARC